MRQSTYRNKVHPTFGIVAQGVESDAAGRLRLITACYHFNGFPCQFGREVIEHDTIHPAQVKHLLQFVEVAHLNLYLEILAFLLAIFFGAGNGLSMPPAKSTWLSFNKIMSNKPIR